MNKAFKKREYKCKCCKDFTGANELAIFSHKKICKKEFTENIIKKLI